MKTSLIPFVLICGMLTISPIGAVSKNVGTSGAAFLKIDVGARPAAMGGAFTAVADDVNATAWNPAGLGTLKSAQFTTVQSQWIQGMKHHFLAGALPTRLGTWGLSLTSLSVDGIDRRSADTEKADNTFGSQDSAYGLIYGRSMGRVSLGLGATFIRQSLDGKSAAALAGSGGALWRTPHEPLTVGLAVRHAGSKIKFNKEGDSLPLTTSLGVGYHLFHDRLTLGVQARQPRDQNIQLAGGAEFRQPFFRDLSGALRAGYNTAGKDLSQGMSLGVGLAWRQWGFDAAWVPYGVLGQTFRYALLMKF
jgi:hypothetical protein